MGGVGRTRRQYQELLRHTKTPHSWQAGKEDDIFGNKDDLEFEGCKESGRHTEKHKYHVNKDTPTLVPDTYPPSMEDTPGLCQEDNLTQDRASTSTTNGASLAIAPVVRTTHHTGEWEDDPFYEEIGASCTSKGGNEG